MVSSDGPGYCHNNKYIRNIQGLQVYMEAYVLATQGGWDGGNVQEIGIGLIDNQLGYWTPEAAWVSGSCFGGWIDGPRYNPRRPFIGSYSNHPWTGANLPWNAPVDGVDLTEQTLQVWLSVSTAHGGYCDITIRVICDGQDHTETMVNAFQSAHAGLLMITGGFKINGTGYTNVPYHTQFIVNELEILEQVVL